MSRARIFAALNAARRPCLTSDESRDMHEWLDRHGFDRDEPERAVLSLKHPAPEEWR